MPGGFREAVDPDRARPFEPDLAGLGIGMFDGVKRRDGRLRLPEIGEERQKHRLDPRVVTLTLLRRRSGRPRSRGR